MARPARGLDGDPAELIPEPKQKIHSREALLPAMDLFIPLIVKNAYVIFTYDPVCFVLLPVSELGNGSVPYAVNKIKATVCVEPNRVSTGVVSTGRRGSI